MQVFTVCLLYNKLSNLILRAKFCQPAFGFLLFARSDIQFISRFRPYHREASVMFTKQLLLASFNQEFLQNNVRLSLQKC